MTLRILSGAVFVLIVGAAIAAGGWAWAAVVVLVTAIGTRELYALGRIGGLRPAAGVGMALGPCLAAAGLWPELALTRPLVALGVVAAFCVQVARPPAERSAPDWAATIAGTVYPATMLGYLVLLRELPESGPAWTALLFAQVWANDSAAYLAGRAVGRRPFFASLSPKKTLEGALAGLGASVAVGLAFPAAAAAVGGGLAPLSTASPWTLGLLGALVAVAGPAGDLSKSFLKRQAGVKDSGDLIPGHGGILDRFDSTIFAAPVLYYAALWLSRR